MNTRRIICTLLGMWIGASLFMAVVAASSFIQVNELIVNPAPETAPYFKILGAEKVGLLARHQASEFNRTLFENWGIAQIILGLLVFGMLLFGTKEGKVILGLSLLMVLLVTGMHLFITPSIIGYGRGLDFVSIDKEESTRKRVRALHNAYSTLEVVKLLAGVGLLIIFFREVPRRGSREDNFEAA